MSAFAPFATATLTFWIPEGTLLTPLGNPTTATAPVVLLAYLTADRSYRAQPQPDGVATGQGMSGRLVAPGALPQSVQDGQAGEVVFWRLGPGFALPQAGFEELGDYQDFVAENAEAIAATGEFILEVSPPGGFGVEAILGDKIRGRFVARSSWADSI
jgi:hypothetical protein